MYCLTRADLRIPPTVILPLLTLLLPVLPVLPIFSAQLGLGAEFGAHAHRACEGLREQLKNTFLSALLADGLLHVFVRHGEKMKTLVWFRR
jgi:hypothetical protein